MKSTRILALLLLLATTTPAQAPIASDIAFAGTLTNGRFWSQCMYDEKLVWLLGYSDGIKSAAALIGKAEPGDKLLQAILALQPTDRLTHSEIVQGIDRFYIDTPENGSVPVTGALRYVESKAKGATQAELDDLARSMRKAATTIEK